jgi:6-hydroxynicotinate 3-monooxygenase
MASTPSIAVVGGGIGGVTAALLLQKAGYECHVYEQTHAITRIGAGINLYPNGTRVLCSLGLEKQLFAVGLRHQAKQSRDFDSGRLTYSIDCKRLEDLYGAPVLCIHRGDLAQILTSSLLPGTLHLDRSLTALNDTGGEVHLTFANGATATADIVIGADGVNSKVREILLGPEKPIYSGDVAYRALFPMALLNGFKLEDHCKWWHDDRRFMLIYYITAGREEAYFVGGAPEPVWGKDDYSPMKVSSEHVQKVFHDFHPDVLRVLEAAPEASRWAILERDPLPLWSRGRVVVLGDACHPMTPYMGQGGSMALEDAAMLVRCLQNAGDSHPQSAFQLYEANRADRTRRVQLESKKGDWQRYEMDHEWVMGYDAFTVPLVEPKSKSRGVALRLPVSQADR